MQSRGLTVAAIVLAILAGLLWWSNREKAKEASKPAPDTTPKILTLTDANIKQIALKKRSGDETVIAKNAAGKWEMTAPKPYGVDQDAANSLASSAATVNADRVVDDKPTDLKQYGLENPTTEVDITQKDGKTSKLLIGDDAPGGSSTYAKLAGKQDVYTIASYTKSNFDKTPKDLRDKRLLTFDQDKLTRVELKRKNEDIEFGRSKDAWQIVKPKPLRADGLQVEELVRKLKDAKMDPNTSDDDAKKAATNFASGTPIATVAVTDNSGSEDLQIRKKGDDYYAKSSVVDGLFKVPNDLGTGVDKSVDDFRNKKLFDFGFNEPSKVEVHDNGKIYSFQKSGDKWSSAGKEMDNTSVQALLDKLRDLSATKFVDSGLTTPVVDITVMSNDSKRVEKVLISKSGDKYVAQRENEPSLYELDTKTVDDMTRAAGDVKPAQQVKKK